MLAAMVLGAEGVQMGTRFVASQEASSHPLFKQKLLESKEGDTLLTMKQLTPVRLLRNEFFEKVLQAEKRGASADEMREILGKGRSRLGMFEGNLNDGELEIGQVSANIDRILPAKAIIEEVWKEFNETLANPILL